MGSAQSLASNHGFDLTGLFLLTFAAAIPAIVSGGIAERARFYPMLICSFFIVGLVYPLFEGIAWNVSTSASKAGCRPNLRRLS